MLSNRYLLVNRLLDLISEYYDELNTLAIEIEDLEASSEEDGANFEAILAEVESKLEQSDILESRIIEGGIELSSLLSQISLQDSGVE